MIVRIRGIEVVCESLEELDRLIERYGDAEGVVVRSGATIQGAGGNPTTGAGIDLQLLRAFINAPGGVLSGTVTGMLNARGKGIPGALKAWCARIHLAPGAVEPASPGGKRGWRLTESGQEAAKVILNG